MAGRPEMTAITTTQHETAYHLSFFYRYEKLHDCLKGGDFDQGFGSCFSSICCTFRLLILISPDDLQPS